VIQSYHTAQLLYIQSSNYSSIKFFYH